MGIWCDIQSHPTRPCPLPHPKPRPLIFNTFVPAKRTNRVADLQEQLFPLFFLDSSKYRCPQQVFRSEDDHLRESFPVTAKIVSKNTHVRKRFLFFYSVLLHCQSSDRPFIAACAIVRSSVQRLHVRSFCKSATSSENLGTHGSDKRKYSKWAWLWVGQWVWPVEMCSDITSTTHIIFLSRDIT